MRIRTATSKDVSLIFSFIQKKAEFDRAMCAFSGILQVCEGKIEKTLFGEIPFAYVSFAEQSERAIGFALYGFRYSSFAGQPSIWLDDLYVSEEMRSQGAGTALMNHLVGIAKTHHCTHLAWTADTRNTRGLSFYNRLGAKVIEKKGNQCFFQWIL
ncbi:GNAT family N-acetyltransferase [Lusitaniella coriacea LEGE 07157]|uniref:GNAT family N-acetyltransferase n=1 Tax=Lusitaniella coriacea LEGE 07157 TaxID=945747 RepID=A0A8J7B3T9_9CYAN|nr:GNAT family N-acetyltransferase [Lusitaniella coriacea]MBE9115322.1 GNAT family N-acetyltransferase [Lusitaniella coriacea LEGE 07157]